MQHQIIEKIQNKIYTIRKQKVMLDKDLAELFCVETKRLKEQVKRNIGKFPDEEFMFVMTEEEFQNLRSQNATSSWGGSRYAPMCFTEHGVLQVANVLNSDQANKMSVFIIKAFVKMRQALMDISLSIEKHEKFQLLMNILEKYEKSLEKIDSHDKEIKELRELVYYLINQSAPPKKQLVIKGFTTQS